MTPCRSAPNAIVRRARPWWRRISLAWRARRWHARMKRDAELQVYRDDAAIYNACRDAMAKQVQPVVDAAIAAVMGDW